MDWHLIQGGVAIYLVTSQFRIQINLDEIDHYAWVETLSFTILFLLSVSLMGKKNPLKIFPTLPKYGFVAQLVVVPC